MVLLVDDDDGARLSTADMLGELGFTVRQASSGAAAPAALDHGLGVDVVVTDHLMPGITGGELAAALKLSRPALPVLIVSGFAEHAGIDSATLRLAKPLRRANWRKASPHCGLGRTRPTEGSGAARWTNWSGRRDSNPRPRPWQGRALPLSYARSGRYGGVFTASGFRGYHRLSCGCKR